MKLPFNILNYLKQSALYSFLFYLKTKRVSNTVGCVDALRNKSFRKIKERKLIKLCI